MIKQLRWHLATKACVMLAHANTERPDDEIFFASKAACFFMSAIALASLS